MKEVIDYIHNNWINSIREPQRGVPYPFTSPSSNGFYKDFYYWDTYFINIGLMIDGNITQVQNNLDNISYFIQKYGYMPNANNLLYRTQPPFFTRAVFDYWKYTNDTKVIERYLDSMIKESNFFDTKRKNKETGLNAYGCDDSYEHIMEHYRILHNRVSLETDDPVLQERIGKELIIIAESGLDFNKRFMTGELCIAASEFIHLDLNCILYDAEVKLSEMLNALNKKEQADYYLNKSIKRKELINKYFLKDGIYVDYNFIKDNHSKVLSAASLYPYTFNISNDPVGCKKILEGLELPYGVTVCPYRGEDTYFQWDYPTVWGEASMLIYWALINCNLKEDADRIKNKFINTVDRVFIKAHKIFEKYDGITGDISNKEYNAPEMMGWSAAAYSYFSKVK